MEDHIKTIKNILLFFLVVLILYLCKVLGAILVPLLLAFFIALLLYPLLKYLVSKKIPVAIALPLTVFAPLPFLSLAIEAIRLSMVRLYINYPEMKLLFLGKLDEYGVDVLFLYDLIEEFTQDMNFSKMASSVGGELTSFAGSFVTVLLYLFFILVGLLHYKESFLRIEGQENGKWVLAFEEIKTSIAVYIRVKFLASLALGALVAIQCAIYKIELPVFWGFFCFVMNFIPNIGSIIASGLCVMFSVLYLSPISALIFGVIQIAFQQVIGNVIEPIYLDSKLSINPLVILLGLFVWGYIFGIVGALLSVPLIVLFKIVASKIPSLYTWSLLIGSDDDD